MGDGRVLSDDVLVYEHKSSPLLPRGLFIHRMARHIGATMLLVAVSLLAGMIGYVALGRMSWVDAFMNSAMLLGGMGPVGDLPSDSAKVFAGLFALYAGLVFIVSAGVIIAPVAHRIFHGMHLDERDKHADATQKPAARPPK